MNCEAVGMCLQAGAVMSAETSDFLFNLRDLKVLSEDHVKHVPWCISYHAQSFESEAKWFPERIQANARIVTLLGHEQILSSLSIILLPGSI
jgi:hypothetical protein